VASLPGDQAGETLSATLNEVQPSVLPQGGVAVGFACRLKEGRQFGEVIRTDVAFQLNLEHSSKLSGAPGRLSKLSGARERSGLAERASLGQEPRSPAPLLFFEACCAPDGSRVA